MKVVVLSDLHLVSPEDPNVERRRRRSHFADAWPFFRTIAGWIQDEAPDLVVSVGDLVDWYSDENRDFAIQLMNELNVPWLMTPGNHDFTLAGDNGEKEFSEHRHDDIQARWNGSGIELENRVLETGSVRLFLVDSHNSSVPEGTCEWLLREMDNDLENVVITHVPINLPEVINYILSVDSKKDLVKYVQSGAPSLFEQCLAGRVKNILTGHLHFPGYLRIGGTNMHLLPLSITAVNKKYTGQGQIAILDTDTVTVRMRGPC